MCGQQKLQKLGGLISSNIHGNSINHQSITINHYSWPSFDKRPSCCRLSASSADMASSPQLSAQTSSQKQGRLWTSNDKLMRLEGTWIEKTMEGSARQVFALGFLQEHSEAYSVWNILELFQLLQQLFMFCAASAPVLQLYAGGTCAFVSAATPAVRRGCLPGTVYCVYCYS